MKGASRGMFSCHPTYFFGLAVLPGLFSSSSSSAWLLPLSYPASPPPGAPCDTALTEITLTEPAPTVNPVPRRLVLVAALGVLALLLSEPLTGNLPAFCMGALETKFSGSGATGRSGVANAPRSSPT